MNHIANLGEMCVYVHISLRRGGGKGGGGGESMESTGEVSSSV